MAKTAVLLGASGLTGSILLNKLLHDDRYEKVALLGRSSAGKTHPKIEEHVVDMLQLSQFSFSFKADELYCCIGTTASKTPNKEDYKAIDYGIPYGAAELCQRCNIDTFIVISSMGADANSRIFYNRVKGMMESAVLDKKIPKTHILRPSLIGGLRDERRPGEWLSKKFMLLLNPLLLGPARKFRSIDPEKIAAAMLWLANHRFDKKIIFSDEIESLAHQSARL